MTEFKESTIMFLDFNFLPKNNSGICVGAHRGRGCFLVLIKMKGDHGYKWNMTRTGDWFFHQVDTCIF